MRRGWAGLFFYGTNMTSDKLWKNTVSFFTIFITKLISTFPNFELLVSAWRLKKTEITIDREYITEINQCHWKQVIIIFYSEQSTICTSTEIYWPSGAEEEVWWGFSLFVTTMWCVCSFPARGSILMPTYHHLPEIKTGWMWRVDQEEMETGGTGGFGGVAWGKGKGWEQEEGRGREIGPWACFVQMTYSSV